MPYLRDVPSEETPTVKVKKTTHKTTWKAFEREVAKMFGSQRTSLSGGNSKITRSDSMHEQIFVEAKFRQQFELWTLYEKTEELAVLENKIPLVAIKKKGCEGFLLLLAPEDLIPLAKFYQDELTRNPKLPNERSAGARSKSRKRHERRKTGK